MTDYLLSFTVQVSALLVAALATTAVLRRRSAAVRHWVLAAAIVCAACLPILRAVVPGWAFDLAPRMAAAQRALGADTISPAGLAEAERAGARAPEADAPAAQAVSWPVTALRLIPVVWAVGAAAGLAVLITGLARLTWLARRARAMTHPAWVRAAGDAARDLDVRRPVGLLHTDHPSLLAAWGLIRPRIMLPRSAGDWPADQVAIVIRHEMAHLARGDWFVQIVAETLRAMNWFNPVVWAAAQRLRAESELACDDAVVVGGVNGSEYAERLLALARALHVTRRWSPGFPAPAMARPSSLERRIAAMLDPGLNRVPPAARTRAAIAGLALAVAIPMAGLAVFAQAPYGFTGSVLDPTNRALPNTRVVLTNLQTQASQEVVSDKTGRFEFTGLPVGDYAMEVRLPGFATLKGTVTVTATGLKRDLNLQVGSVQETINVSIGAAAGSATPAAPRPVRTIEPMPPCSDTVAVGGNIRAPRKLRDVKPAYPENLRAEKVLGKVVVQGIIGTERRTGRVGR